MRLARRGYDVCNTSTRHRMLRTPFWLVVALVACADGRRAPPVVISEIMYHPAQEGAEDLHEFVEVHNRSDSAVSLGGWNLKGEIDYRFPDGYVLPGGAFAVVARSPRDLAKVYGLDPATVLGPYEGQLDNGGGQITLADELGQQVESALYDDAFPWPIGADALGAGEAWLPPDWRGNHQSKGRSLERVSFDASGAQPSTWTASPIDGATPGAANSVRGEPLRIVERLEVTDGLVRVELSRPGPATLEYFVDDIEKEDEPRSRLPLPAQLPTETTNAIIRFRILGEEGKVISPRESDPYRWHATFVSPELPGRTRAYQIFISRANWGRMEGFIAAGRVPANQCQVNPAWNDRVPAVFVVDGKVYDVMTRYQGSWFNRGGGATLTNEMWPVAEQPTPRPRQMRALGWRLYFPRYQPFEGKRDVILNKLGQACQGFITAAGGRMYELAGVPASRVSYARVYLNGRYYHYMAEYERVGEEMLKRFFGKKHVIGDLFKSVGSWYDIGPYGYGDERPLEPACGYSVEQRITYTYDRKTLDWKSTSAEMSALTGQLAAARASRMLRPFFETHFDLPALHHYMAVLSWMGPWDDFYQNHYLYRRADGRWMMIPWDMDLQMGGMTALFGLPTWTNSFYVGEEGNRNNRDDGPNKKMWNHLKDAYYKTYRDELKRNIVELSAPGKPLHPEVVARLVDEAAAGYVREEVAQSAVARSDPKYIDFCGGAANLASSINKFARERHARVMAGAWD